MSAPSRYYSPRRGAFLNRPKGTTERRRRGAPTVPPRDQTASGGILNICELCKTRILYKGEAVSAKGRIITKYMF